VDCERHGWRKEYIGALREVRWIGELTGDGDDALGLERLLHRQLQIGSLACVGDQIVERSQRGDCEERPPLRRRALPSYLLHDPQLHAVDGREPRLLGEPRPDRETERAVAISDGSDRRLDLLQPFHHFLQVAYRYPETVTSPDPHYFLRPVRYSIAEDPTGGVHLRVSPGLLILKSSVNQKKSPHPLNFEGRGCSPSTS